MWLKGVAVAGAVGLLALTVLWMRCGIHGCPDVALLNGYNPDEASVVLDRDGEEIGKLYRVRRVVVPLEELPGYVPSAFVAVEDKDFWRHEGVDWSRALGALAANVKAGGVEEGFSTITMQLARNLFPEKLPAEQRTLWRKLGEIRVAQQIEDRYSKEEILEMYVNQIYFGEGAWGIEAAAQEYFGVSARELTLEQAALLAGLPKAPSRLNPRVDPEAARRRRDLVLRRMAQQGLIEEGSAEALMAEPVELAEAASYDADDVAPYFVEEVRRRLEHQLGEAIYTDGYRIHTTLDLDAQRVAEAELEEQIRSVERGAYGAYRHEGMEAGGAYLQGAVVVMDAHRGDVVALVGGRAFSDSEFNRATQALRQPGSAFKPFVYATALAAGYPLTTALEDTPLRLVRSGQVWEPKNYGGAYAGVITLRDALVHSKNVATIRLARQVGLERVIQTAQRMGIDREIPPYPSVVLGTVEVTPLELTAAYAAFATLGSRPEPRFVTAVEDRAGNVVWAAPPETARVLDPAVAFLVTDVLSDVVSRGTGTAVRAVGFRGAAAGKTGTTDDGTDAWFVGYTPERVATVWIGFDDPRPIVAGATGGELAAPVWGRLMRRVGSKDGDWQVPAGVERYALTPEGTAIPTSCPGADAMRQEYFLVGRAPVAPCPSDSYDYEYDYDYGPAYEDSALLGEEGRDEAWWDRLRRRLFGEPEPLAEPRRRPEPRRPVPPVTLDTAAPPPAAEPVPRAQEGEGPPRQGGSGGAARRPAPPPLGRPIRPDTTRGQR